MENKFSAEVVEKIFKPFLLKLAELRELTDRKIIAYIISEDQEKIFELAKFLEKISLENIMFTNIRACSLENFQENEIDLEKLQEQIREIKIDDDEDDKIILIAGNNLLLNGNIRALADYTVVIQAEENISVVANEIWKTSSDGDFVKVDDEDDEEIFIDNIQNEL